MKFEVLRLDDQVKWRQALDSIGSVNTDVYDLPEYYATWELYEEAEPHCVVAEQEGTLLVYPFFKKQIDGYDLDGDYYDVFTAYGYGGPATNVPVERRSIRAAFNEAIDSWMRDNAVVAEFIRCSPYRESSRIREAEYIRVRTNVEVSLEAEQEMWSALSGTARRNIKRAQSAGIEVTADTDLATVVQFARLYGQTAQRLAVSTYYRFPLAYFDRTAKQLEGSAVILNAALNGSTVASALCLRSPSRWHYHLGCSDPEFLALRPNDLLFWEMIRHATRAGASTLELGGGTGNDPDDPLLRFKSKFGSLALPTYIGTRVHRFAVYESLRARWSARYPNLVPSRGNMFLSYRFKN